MQRYSSEYIITIRIPDIMITTEETESEVKEKIKTIGQNRLKEWVDNGMNTNEDEFLQEINITAKGL